MFRKIKKNISADFSDYIYKISAFNALVLVGITTLWVATFCISTAVCIFIIILAYTT